MGHPAVMSARSLATLVKARRFGMTQVGNRQDSGFTEIHMQAFQIRYRNTQGTLMRILNAVSRRGLDMPSVHADAAGENHQATLVLEVNSKQVGQLFREWYAITDVIHVRSGSAEEMEWTTPHPPVGVPAEESRAAARA
jgi:acetolactate synthase regulatory subunit